MTDRKEFESWYLERGHALDPFHKAVMRDVWQASRKQALEEAKHSCWQIANCEENTDGYRNGAAWCAEKIRSLK